ncbi:retrovirus-related pol polyprotein from transposon TNT 1-94 [Tanacetum coccineum]|uniref:Retrovirus-related pol polyprotein from transposon TNT 1-94 n=1 Tax=Tanacetum coccineum TaxID=301880 RepID=A0ABQ5FUU8_9ASTR
MRLASRLIDPLCALVRLETFRTLPTPRFKVGESSVVAAARQLGSTMAYRVVVPSGYKLDCLGQQKITIVDLSSSTHPYFIVELSVDAKAHDGGGDKPQGDFDDKEISRLIVAFYYVAEMIVQNIIFIVDFGCTKHMTGNLKLLCNFVERYLGTVRFENDQFAPILGYGDLVQRNVTIKMFYYVEGLNHNLFSGNDLLTGNRESDLYIISLQETSSPTLICFMAKASPTQAWLWHRRLSYLNFDTINLLSKKDIMNGLLKLKYVKDQLCSYCELGKAKRSTFNTKNVPSSKRRLNLLHMDLCGPMRIESINGKKYIFVIVDDYSRYTWTHFMRSKDETP